jgi:DNA polymerase-4
VIVGATSPRGVVAAASYEARTYGVRSAMPGFRARELCPDGVYLPADMARYAAVSAQVHEVWLSFTPQIEPLALDEAFLDISGSVGLFGGPVALARKLKQAVRDATELTVSVGVAPSKLVAKIACTLGKPDGLRFLAASEVEDFLAPLPVRRLWGVGPVLERQILGLNIKTLGQLARADPVWLERALGSRAHELQSLARGLDTRAVEHDREPKSYGEENTFETDLIADHSDRDRVTSALTAHAETVARRLRRDGYRGRTITLKVKFGRTRGARPARDRVFGADEPVYPLITRSKTLAAATDDGAVIRSVAIDLWDHAKIAEPVRLLGVSLSNLERRHSEQLDLFGRARVDRLGPTLDQIQARFGVGAIARAVDAPGKITATSRKKRGEF